jgi:hypothetical protein
MKKVILNLLSLCILLPLYSQDEKPLKFIEQEKVYRYEEVVNYDVSKAGDVYDKILKYVKQNLKPNDGTLLESKEQKDQISMTGQAVLKDITTFVNPMYSPVMEYNLNIYFKDGRIKIIIDKILLQGLDVKKKPTSILDYNTLPDKDSKAIEKYKAQPNEFVLKVSTDIKNILNGADKKDDW